MWDYEWFLDPLVDNLTCNLYYTKCKHCMKCKDCKKYWKYKVNDIEWCEICKACIKLSHYCNDWNRIYEDFLGVKKCERKIAKSPKYYTSKFPDLFNF